MTHKLKVWKQFFPEIRMKLKTFEVRLNDRNFQAGDDLELCEWDNEVQELTGRKVEREVIYTLQGGQFGIEEGYVVMSIK